MSDELHEDLIEATSEFGITYTVAKEAEKEAKTAQTKFYELANADLQSRRLPRKSVKVIAGKTPEEYVAAFHPEWRIYLKDNPEDPSEIVIERDPAKMRYVFINPEDGQIYQRTTQDKGGTQVDEERLKAEDPKLWEEISHWDPTMHALVQAALVWSCGEHHWEPEDLDAEIEGFFIDCRPDLRVVKPPVAWSQGQAGRLQQYLIPPGITVKIVPPRAATEEELEAHAK